jgi:8-oxo-dGTP pyrophosphatase MutT (NUDIX family)
MGFPLARLYWRLRGKPHHGTQVAIWVDGKVLCVRPSYRGVLTFPGGGVEPGEDPAAAAQRELLEELDLSVPRDRLRPVFTARGRWDGRPDTVTFFELMLDAAPAVRVDNREILAAMFLDPAGLTGVAASVAAYLCWRLSGGVGAATSPGAAP